MGNPFILLMYAGTKIYSSALQRCENFNNSLDTLTQRVSTSGEAAVQDMSSKLDAARHDLSQGDAVWTSYHMPVLCGSGGSSLHCLNPFFFAALPRRRKSVGVGGLGRLCTSWTTVESVRCCCPGSELQEQACKDLEASAQSCSQAQQLLCKDLTEKLSMRHNAAEGESQAVLCFPRLGFHSCVLIHISFGDLAEFGLSHLEGLTKLESLIAEEVSEKYEANPHQGE